MDSYSIFWNGQFLYIYIYKNCPFHIYILLLVFIFIFIFCCFLYLGQIRIKCISVSVLFVQNGHAKSAFVVSVANRSLCVFNGESTQSYSYEEIFGRNVFQVVQVG